MYEQMCQQMDDPMAQVEDTMLPTDSLSKSGVNLELGKSKPREGEYWTSAGSNKYHGKVMNGMEERCVSESGERPLICSIC